MIKHLEINSSKIKKERKFLLISDIHRNKRIHKDNLDKLKEDLKEEFLSIDYIIIAGDIIDTPKHLKDEKFIEELTKKIKEFTNKKPTFIVFGNHDIVTRDPRNEYLYTILNRIHNVKCLDNKEIVDIGDISIKGFSPDLEYYKTFSGNKDVYMDQFINNKSNEFSNDTYNILITHDPTSIIELSKQKGTCIAKNTDLVVSGHMHNG